MDDQQNNQNPNNQVPVNQEPPVYSDPPQPETPNETIDQTLSEPIDQTPSEPIDQNPTLEETEEVIQPEPEMQPEPNLPEPEPEMPQSELISETQSNSVDDAAAKYQQILNEYAASQKQSEVETQSESQPKPEQPEIINDPIVENSTIEETPELPQSESSFDSERPSETFQTEPELPPIAAPEYQTPINENPSYVGSDEIKPEFNIFKTLFIIILFINIIVFAAAGLIYYKTTQDKDDSELPQASPTPESSMTCPRDDKEYKVGESFPTEDGCNTCSCTETGEIVCTEKACNITPTKAATKSATKVTVTPTKAATTSSIPKDLKTYTNKNFKFSLQYPTDYLYKESSVDEEINGGLTNYITFYPKTLALKANDFTNTIRLTMFKTTAITPVMPDGMDPSETKNISIAGTTGKFYIDNKPNTGTYSFIKNGYQYFITCTAQSNDSVIKNFQNLISSFNSNPA